MEKNSTDLRKYLVKKPESNSENLEFNISSDTISPFRLESTQLILNSTNYNSSHLYQLAILACTRIHSTLCDQTLLIINITSDMQRTNISKFDNQAMNIVSVNLETHAKSVGFSYHYGAFTIQQHMQGRK